MLSDLTGWVDNLFAKVIVMYACNITWRWPKMCQTKCKERMWKIDEQNFSISNFLLYNDLCFQYYSNLRFVIIFYKAFGSDYNFYILFFTFDTD